jgi:hypothetical protein
MRGQPPPRTLASMEQSVARAQALQPGMKVAFIAFPGTPFASSHHYGIYMRGDQALTARLYKPVLVDAGSGQVTDQRTLPWYLTALLLSQPLHFGDYGGAGMQFLWALLDLATIVVLGSGLYLWLKRGRAASSPGKARRRQVRAAAGAGPRRRSRDEGLPQPVGHAGPARRADRDRPGGGLLGDGWWDLVSVAGLGIPVLVGAWHMFKPAPLSVRPLIACIRQL